VGLAEIPSSIKKALRNNVIVKKIILTGGPHAGKSSTLKEIEARGHLIIEESAIEVISSLEGLLGKQEYTRWRNENFPAFATLIGHRQKSLEYKVNTYNVTHVFIDRGRIDLAAFIDFFGHSMTQDSRNLVESTDYDKVFLLEIIEPFNDRQETGRSEDRDTAYGIQETIYKTYQDYGYDVIRVPQMPLIDRAAFITKRALELEGVRKEDTPTQKETQ